MNINTRSKKINISGTSLPMVQILPGHQLTALDYAQLTELWERSVRLTHTFLNEQDIAFFRPLLKQQYLPAVPLYLAWLDNSLTGFMGVVDKKVEMLFIEPDHQGQGIGSQLLAYAIQQLSAQWVDVNEQNLQAVKFYLHRGFQQIGRSATDSAGKDFPILHLQYQPTADTLLNDMY